MNFQEAEAVVKSVIPGLDKIEYDGIMVKRLAKSNTLGKREGTNQSHIALTGEQMDVFPYVRLDGYFGCDYSDVDDKKGLKTFFVTQVPFVLWKDNLATLVEDIPEEFSFDDNGTETVYVSTVRSRREDSEQMQLSLLAMDDSQFVTFRRLLKENDYLIILKRKEQLKYDCFGVKAENDLIEKYNLTALNNQFYNLKTQTKIHVDEVVQPQNEPSDLREAELLKKQYNRIIFGAPGTGKSYTLNHDKNTLLQDRKDDDYERVTFHPDYSYANFVGTYKPVPKKGKEDEISYEYVPGPFMRVFVEALKRARANDSRPVLLIIEEINRADVAAVFGDVFQLLDRDSDGVSEYPIQASEDMKKYLADELGCGLDDVPSVQIPNNMYIWATMNSADQGVFPMDTAFKRRWDFKYIGIDEFDGEISGKFVVLGNNPSKKVEWNKLRKAINNYLAKFKINEDKQLGPYFISRDIVVPVAGNEINRDEFISTFKNKVIMYLFDDAAKQKASRLFDGCKNPEARYSEICEKFDKIGIDIFADEIIKNTEAEEI